MRIWGMLLYSGEQKVDEEKDDEQAGLYAEDKDDHVELFLDFGQMVHDDPFLRHWMVVTL